LLEVARGRLQLAPLLAIPLPIAIALLLLLHTSLHQAER
jgi:hypothetical protein